MKSASPLKRSASWSEWTCIEKNFISFGYQQLTRGTLLICQFMVTKFLFIFIVVPGAIWSEDWQQLRISGLCLFIKTLQRVIKRQPSKFHWWYSLWMKKEANTEIGHDQFVPTTSSRMPPLLNVTAKQKAAGQARYEAQLASRSIYEPAHVKLPIFMATARGLFPKGTVRNSQVGMDEVVCVDFLVFSGRIES